jgi:hypothetical protein
MSPYRLIRPGECIQIGDEGLQDDCETWKPIVGWEAGMEYNPVLLVPMRRRSTSPPPPQTDSDRRE